MASPSAVDVLLVEDDPAFAEYLSDVLDGGFEVRHAPSAAEARRQVEEAGPDLIILDLILPDADGLVLCAELRALTDAPILICSATIRRRDAALGLRLGADDFIAKPFDVDELRARVEALLRRGRTARALGNVAPRPAPPRPSEGLLRVGELALNPEARRLTLGGTPIAATPVELRLLAALMSHPGAVLSRQELVHAVWGELPVSSDRVIDIHVRRLREKLAHGPVLAPPIVSVRGFGYKLLESEPNRVAT